VRVLLTLDTRSVDLAAAGVNRTDGDFALAWVRNYGSGRVFYSAFGHFPDNFRLPVFRTMISQALLWLTGQIELDATPRSGPSAPSPAVAPDGVRNLAGPSDAFAPGGLVTIRGEGLTSGSSLAAGAAPLPVRLAGTHVEVDGTPAPLLRVAPDEVLAQLPQGLAPGRDAALTISSVNWAGEPVLLHMEEAAPGILAGFRIGSALALYAVGLGATRPAVQEGAAGPLTELARTVIDPVVRVAGEPATVEFSGLAPGLVGLYQVNVTVPASAAGGSGDLEITLEAAGHVSSTFVLRP
jgi:uncharacterized protein (TIGR03437 family)